jgi:hypothetical protein
MVDAATIEPDSAESRHGSQSDDRRRVGRTDVDRALVPLLRNPAGAGSQHDEPGADSAFPVGQDELGPSRGIFFGIILSLPLWGAIYVSVRLALRFL